MKKTTVIILALLLIFAGVRAENPTVSVIFNGAPVIFENAPYIEDGRTFISVRSVSTVLGFQVDWDEETRTVGITDGKREVSLTIGNTEFYVNGIKGELDAPPRIKENRTMVPLRFIAEGLGCEVDWDAGARTVFVSKIKTVTVSDENGLLENIGDYTKIILKEGTYNLSKAERSDNKAISTEILYDGDEYTVNSVKGLTIEAEENAKVEIVVESRTANVLRFKNCEKIAIAGVTAGHTPNTGECSGGVFDFEDSKNISVDNCKLYGCGTYGIVTNSVTDLQVSGCEIYECTYGVISMMNSFYSEFNDCVMRDCAGFAMFDFYSCGNIKISNCDIKNNVSDEEYFSFIAGSEVDKIMFADCVFENNSYREFCNNSKISFINCGNEREGGETENE